MATAAAYAYITPEEYLNLEREGTTKNEYRDGDIFAMAGASRAHVLITVNIAGELRSRLKGRTCEVYPIDMRVRVRQTTLFAYPDVVVVCGEPRFEDDVFDTLLNPTLIVEVLSPSTEAYQLPVSKTPYWSGHVGNQTIIDLTKKSFYDIICIPVG